MARNFGNNINHNTDATVDAGVQITTAGTAETLSAANDDRMILIVSITGFDAWIRLIPAATDSSVQKGIFVQKDSTWTMPVDNVYTGEISIINVQGLTKPTYYVTEY